MGLGQIPYTRNPNKSKTYLVKLYTFNIDICISIIHIA